MLSFIGQNSSSSCLYLVVLSVTWVEPEKGERIEASKMMAHDFGVILLAKIGGKCTSDTDNFMEDGDVYRF